MHPAHPLLCTQCGAETRAPVRLPAGSPWVALALAVPFILPGLVYTVWRYAMRRTVCPTCGHAALIPGDAPLARTWRASGWLPTRTNDRPFERPLERPLERPFERMIERNLGGAGAGLTTAPEIRLDRIEQAIDAIASEVDRIAQGQRLAPPSALPRERGAITPT